VRRHMSLRERDNTRTRSTCECTVNTATGAGASLRVIFCCATHRSIDRSRATRALAREGQTGCDNGDETCRVYICVYVYIFLISAFGALSGIPSVPWMTAAAFKAPRGKGGEGDEGKDRDRVYTVYMGFFGARHKGTRERIGDEKGGSSWSGLRQLPESSTSSP